MKTIEQIAEDFLLELNNKTDEQIISELEELNKQTKNPIFNDLRFDYNHFGYIVQHKETKKYWVGHKTSNFKKTPTIFKCSLNELLKRIKYLNIVLPNVGDYIMENCIIKEIFIDYNDIEISN